MDITVTDAIDEQTLDAIRQGLRAYNLPHIDASHRKPLSVYARDEAGAVIGGLTAETWGNWLSVEWLWVADTQRGSGRGGRGGGGPPPPGPARARARPPPAGQRGRGGAGGADDAAKGDT
ncbi:hypothetical protein ACUNGZ_22325, partial [Serratia sp. IR-2025]